MPTYIRLTDYKSSDEKEQEFFNPKNRYEAKQEDFNKIPGQPIVFWLSKSSLNTFDSNKIYDYAFSDGKNVTGKNDTFLKQLWEVNSNDIGLNKKWLFMMKGGEYRKWYGNIDYVINWSDEARIYYRKSKIGRLIPEYLWYQKGITWSKISSKKASFRLLPDICTFDEVNITLNNQNDYQNIFSFLNTNVANHLLEATNQTLSIQTENILNLPMILSKNKVLKQKIETLTQQNIDISKEEWDSRETSWDFTKNELIKHKSDSKIETAYSNYCNYWQEKFNILHQNEEELNRLFIDIYELQDELEPDVELQDITILKNETKKTDGELLFQADEIMKQFISYGVGVMFGRYSLDSDGLLIANMGQEVPTSITFQIDDDNVIPVLEDDYFTDDIASRFVQFVKTVFGEEHLSENISFMENSLGVTLRKYFVKGFYEDHIKRYKKRPIYWMVASPKKGFMSLMYMHRYTSDIFATVQNGYLREYMTKLEASRENAQREADDASNSATQRSRASKSVEKINKTLEEIIKFDRETLTAFAQNREEIDLDDGVKVNYCKFKEVLFPITGLCK